MARWNDALSVEDVLAASDEMQGLKGVLSTLVQDALQDLSNNLDTPHPVDYDRTRPTAPAVAA